MHPPASYQTQLAVDLSTDSHRVWLSVPRVSFESARRVSFKSASTMEGLGVISNLALVAKISIVEP